MYLRRLKDLREDKDQKQIAIAELLTLCVTGTFIVLKRNTYHYL